MKCLLTLSMVLLGCQAKEKPEPLEPSADDLTAYTAVMDRLDQMTDNGWVVSRLKEDRDDRKAGDIWHEKDSLIFTGTALAHMPCDRGQPYEDALLAMVETLNGGFWRHPTHPDDISLDGAIGAYRGAAYRIVHCPGSTAKWAEALTKHLDNSNVDWPLEFRYVPELALAVATGTSRPDRDRLVELAAALETWAAAVMISKQACFRINLAYQTIRTVEELGEKYPDQRKANFCAVTKGSGLSTVDHWCGREHIAEWTENFQFNRMEYAHQRCRWEGEDGKPWLLTPAVDYLEGLAEGFDFKESP